jgi:4-hydroxyphenylpyruvate dioxygenase
MLPRHFVADVTTRDRHRMPQRHGLNEKLDAIAATVCFKGVEIFENDLLSFNGTPADVRRAIADARPLRGHLPAVPRLRGHARAASASARSRRRAQVRPDGGAGLRSADGVLQCLAGERSAASTAPPPISASSASAPRSAACASASRRWPGAATSTTIAMPGRWCGAPIIPRSAWCSTASTSWRAAPTSAPIRAIPRDRIFLVQVADAPQARHGLPVVEPAFRNFPGQGDLPLGAFMDALQTTGFDGLFSLEIFNDQFRAGLSPQVAIDGQRSLVNLLDELQRDRARAGRRPAEAAAARAHASAPSSSNSPWTRRRRSSSSAGRARLSPAGVHKSKAVTRWRQGDINLVVNTEQGRFRPFLQHHPRHGGMRASASRSMMRRRRSTVRAAARSRRSGRPSAPASSTSRRCAASAAA